MSLFDRIRQIACRAMIGMFALALPATVQAQIPIYLTHWGSYGAGPSQFIFPAGVVTDAQGDVYVSDNLLDRIQKFSSDGTFLGFIATHGSGDGQLATPYGLAIGHNGRLYVADTSNQRVQVLTLQGAYVTQWGSYGTGEGQFDLPNGVAVNSAGDVFVVDYGGRVQKVYG